MDFWVAPAAWAAIGWLVFFLSVVAILVNWSADRDVVSIDETANQADDPNWENSLTLVTGQHFVNREVVLDGYAYRNCKFQHVTFKYGGGYLVFEGNDVGQHVIEPSTEEAKRFANLLVAMGHLKSQIMDERGPITQEEWDRRHGNRRDPPG